MTRRLLLTALLAGALLPARIIPGRYIVQLDDNAGTSVRVRARLEQKKLKVRGGTRRVGHTLFVEAASADELRALPGVRRVTPVREFKLYLDQALPLHRVHEVWNRVGAENAGAGVKIGIIDTGIDIKHAAFVNDALPALAGYPKTGKPADLAYTNTKVIAARSYVSLLSRPDPDDTPADRVGHGTAVASVAAGLRAVGPQGTIQGVAPGARVGVYKIFGSPNVNDGTNDEAILAAIDDAVNDGMDVINLSLGSDYTPRLEDDPVVQALEKASRAGVIVVTAAGNAGPGPSTLGSPSTAPSALAVGATTNARVFASGVEIAGREPVAARAGDKFGQAAPITATLADVLPLDGDGQACNALPAASLAGRIALVQRGTCIFETKLLNVQRAGAVAALVYTLADAPDLVTMVTGAATVPAASIRYDDGVALRAQLGSGPVTATVRFTPGPLASVPYRLAAFSSTGPGVDLALKPEVTATGTAMYMATQTNDAQGGMFAETGYVAVQGTSFSSPLVAGVAALVKAARPGLPVEAYRSLIVNTARALAGPVAQYGAGSVDAAAAVDSTLWAAPAALSFGVGATTKSLGVATLDPAGDTLTVEVSPMGDGPAPVAPPSVRLDGLNAAKIELTWSSSTLAPGVYQGFVVLTSTRTGQRIRVPYWLASPTGTPSLVRLVEQTASGRAGANLRDAIFFRVNEATGLVLETVEPQVTLVSGNGSVGRVVSYNSDIPGLFGVDVRLGLTPGANVFRIRAGEATLDVSITGR